MASFRWLLLSSDENYRNAFAYAPSPSPSPVQLHDYSVESPNTKSNQHLTFILLAGASVIATCFLLLTYYIVLLRHRSFRPSQTTRFQYPSTDDDEGDFVHHVWSVRTVGLDAAIIDSIPFFPYERCDGAKIDGGSDCSVCLSEFDKGEMVRLLPKCSHLFHLNCIDVWLRSNVNCPLCRTHIVTDEPSPSSASVGFSANGDVGQTLLETPLEENGVDGESAGGESQIASRVDHTASYLASSSVLESGIVVDIDTSGNPECPNQLDGNDRHVDHSQRPISTDGFSPMTNDVEDSMKQQHGNCVEGADYKEKEVEKEKEVDETDRNVICGGGGNSSSSFLSRLKGRSTSILPL